MVVFYCIALPPVTVHLLYASTLTNIVYYMSSRRPSLVFCSSQTYCNHSHVLNLKSSPTLGRVSDTIKPDLNAHAFAPLACTYCLLLLTVF